MDREELMHLTKEHIRIYEDFKETIIPTLEKFVVCCKKRSLAVKLNNLLVKCNSLYVDLNEIHKTKSWIPIEEMKEKVVGFEKCLNIIQKEYIILTRDILNENNENDAKR